MVPDAYVNHVPVLTGGVGKEQLREFYSKHFIPKMPADTEIVPISRTIGSERLVDEMIIRFTHDIEIDWMLPGIAPTGKRVECATVAVVTFRDGKLFSEHIYWDQASVLVQLGLLDPSKLARGGSRDRKKSDRSHITFEPINAAERDRCEGLRDDRIIVGCLQTEAVC